MKPAAAPSGHVRTRLILVRHGQTEYNREARLQGQIDIPLNVTGRRQAAVLANADSFIRRLPDGYNTQLSGDGDNLSQGQRQLLAIARVAVAKPPVFILDEATSSIDTRTEAHIQDAFAGMMAGRTSFVVAHRLSTIQSADVILMMENGQVIEQGTHEQLLAKNGAYARLYRSQFAPAE